MKQILTIIFTFFFALNTNSQNTEENSPNRGQDPCGRPKIVTDPFNPFNSEWYSLGNQFNWMDYVTLQNNFKARIPYFDNSNIYGGGNNSIRYFTNPFFDKDEDYLKHINLYSNHALFYNLANENNFNNIKWLADDMDITNVEHGWELLWKFDGYEANGVTPISGAMSGVNTAANFILYNRYTGMLRWFTAPKVQGTSYTELESLIEFSDNNHISSLFRHNNGLDQALDKPTQILRVASPAKTSFSNEHFSMADFNISYDPCVCYFDSKLSYKLNGVNTANINLYGRLEGTSQMLTAQDAINSDRLLSLYLNRDFKSQVENGLLEYKNYNKMVDDFEKLENKSNIFDDISDASKVAKDIAELGMDVVLSTKDPKKSLKTISKFTAFASMPFKTDKGTKSPPMLIQAQMSITGQLNSNTHLNGFSFTMHTPGSFKTSLDLNMLNSPNNPDRFEYPIYNQAMGLYALLKTPFKDIAKASEIETTIKVISIGQNSGGNVVKDSITKSLNFIPREAFKLKQDLSYTFNPSAQINFEATKTEAAWMIEVENISNNDFWLFTSQNMRKTYSYVNAANKTITVFSSDFIPFECISQFIPVFDFELSNKAKRTELQFPDYNGPLNIWLTNRINEQISEIFLQRPKIVNTYLKINITYRYNKPNGQGLNNLIHFETYKYEIEGNSLNQNILSAPSLDALSAPSELVIENRNFTANETIFAWDLITLKGNINSNPAVSVTIQSAGEIIVDPNAEIDPEITLLIGNPALCNPIRIQPTVIDAAYCNNANKYKGNSTLAKKGNTINSTPLIEPINQSIIYPNPTTSGDFILETILANESYIHLSIFDLTGKLIYKHHSEGNMVKGKHKLELNNLLLENGLFLVQVETNEGTKTHKLIKN